MIIMKNTKIINGQEFNIISCSDNCHKCRFQCEIIVEENKTVNLNCKHPKGPGKPEHCIYFKPDLNSRKN